MSQYGQKLGSPDPCISHLRMLPFLRPGAFTRNVEAFQPQGLAVRQNSWRDWTTSHSVLGNRTMQLTLVYYKVLRHWENKSVPRNRTAQTLVAPDLEATPVGCMSVLGDQGHVLQEGLPVSVCCKSTRCTPKPDQPLCYFKKKALYHWFCENCGSHLTDKG